MRIQRIRIKPDSGKVEISGWLSNHKKGTYLWLGLGGHCIGHVGGYKLYRLAKAIVNRYESAKK